jgi:hypothetical protein
MIEVYMRGCNRHGIYELNHPSPEGYIIIDGSGEEDDSFTSPPEGYLITDGSEEDEVFFTFPPEGYTIIDGLREEDDSFVSPEGALITDGLE